MSSATPLPKLVGVLDAEIQQKDGVNFAQPVMGLFPVYNFPKSDNSGTCPAIQVHGTWFQVNPVHASASKGETESAERLKLLEAENLSLWAQIVALQAQLAQAAKQAPMNTPADATNAQHNEVASNPAFSPKVAPAASTSSPSSAKRQSPSMARLVAMHSDGNTDSIQAAGLQSGANGSSARISSATASPVTARRKTFESLVVLELPPPTTTYAATVSPRRPPSLPHTPRSPNASNTDASEPNGDSGHVEQKENQGSDDWKQSPGPGFGEIWRCDYDFMSPEAAELDFKLGDMVSIVNKVDEQWWVAKSMRTGEFGLVPVNHLSQPPQS